MRSFLFLGLVALADGVCCAMGKPPFTERCQHTMNSVAAIFLIGLVMDILELYMAWGIFQDGN